MARSIDQVRSAFLDFFAARGHEVVRSGPLVPPNDPTLLFANAGMVQFKDLFTGREARSYKRATSSQKCIRISGKHNDLEAVGPSPRHHTFFEMLGNFSFGDYFKEEAIVYAWELLGELDIPKDRVVCTYFRGEDGLPADEAARELWKKVTGFGDDRVIGLGMADNFWQMGDTGPCGPSSELHIFNGPGFDPSTFGAEQTSEGFGWMEIWNLVFMQFERSRVGDQFELTPLPAPSIDTGAGLERLASVLQGQTSNYEIDLLRALVDRAAELARKPYTKSMAPDDVSMRVIADHARTTAFLIAEGVLPDRVERPYVLRRVMRRAIRHGHRLGITEPFLHLVADRVIELMGDHYPELRERRDLILSVSLQEEERFRRTIERGLGLLDAEFARLDATGSKTLGGAEAFTLYDTYGFPLDLTEVICAERSYQVDHAGYEAALGEARRRSEFKGAEQAVEGVYREALARVPGGAVVFTGYDKEQERADVVALIQGGRLVERAEAGDEVEVVTTRTPFYGEAGGQVGDTGVIRTAAAKIDVTDTRKPIQGLSVHRGTVADGAISVGESAALEIDVARRDAIRRNHSATHLLHHALRGVLGEHAQQKGSLVGPERLRFDFTHGKPLAAGELTEIEDRVNRAVLDNHRVQTEILDMDEARRRGAMMIFEEKYGEVVRMLTMGESMELCGGTHARATGDIGLFKITAEQGVAAGVRRIVATTGEGSLAYLRELEHGLSRAAEAAKATPSNLVEKIEKLALHERALEKQVEELQRRLATGGGGGGLEVLLSRARDIAGVKVLGVHAEVADRGALRELAEQLRDKLGESVVLVGSEAEGKAQLVLTVSKSLGGRFPAGTLIRPIAELVGGSGGGRPDMAQAGGTNPGRLAEAIEAIYSSVS
ncbi:MAG: alanine--tRNA ligase [Sorangiineae bacterium]|nr:alanine--tRNA ligase [Polyangiaceae bacterium]MEB2322410.1 alanine--tRNA ligase [Sorangiineae bacterium]